MFVLKIENVWFNMAIKGVWSTLPEVVAPFFLFISEFYGVKFYTYLPSVNFICALLHIFIQPLIRTEHTYFFYE